MIVQLDLPLVNSEAAARCPTCADPRVRAFIELVQAVDCNATQAAIAQIRTLRKLGFSVCMIGKGGGR